jgi:hypothetical protein
MKKKAMLQSLIRECESVIREMQRRVKKLKAILVKKNKEG